MCGIVGMVSDRTDLAQDLVRGIARLEYRGYDSCGVAVRNGSAVLVRKDVGGPSDLQRKGFFQGLSGTIGIAHTRWATHGGVNQVNAHPHVSGNGKVAIVHNGVLSNYRELRQRLKSEGYEFKSATDSEAIAHLIQRNMDRGASVREAVRQAALEVDGTYAVVVMVMSEPFKMWGLRKESPLVVGFADDRAVLASDVLALASLCEEFVYLEDGELVELNARDCQIFHIRDGQKVERSRKPLQADFDAPELGEFSHFMAKEMAECVSAARSALLVDDDEIRNAARSLLQADRAFLTGMGTAYHMAYLGNHLFALTCGRYFPMVTADELPGVVRFTAKDAVLGVSQSGETYDTLKAIRVARASGAKTLAIVNVSGSSMAREVDQALLQGAGPEVAVLATKSALSQAFILARIAVEAGALSGSLAPDKERSLRKELENMPSVLQEWRPSIDSESREAAAHFMGLEKWFFLGRGLYAPVAYEGALKFKEVTYRHAEGMAAGFLKHGTISLIDSEMGTAIFIPPGTDAELRSLTLTALEEVRTRGGPVLAVGALSEEERHHVDAVIGTTGQGQIVDAFLQILTGQYLAYHTARALGRDVDRPRALAKSVTVP